jgi:Thioredoxin like C-terminal domain
VAGQAGHLLSIASVPKTSPEPRATRRTLDRQLRRLHVRRKWWSLSSPPVMQARGLAATWSPGGGCRTPSARSSSCRLQRGRGLRRRRCAPRRRTGCPRKQAAVIGWWRADGEGNRRAAVRYRVLLDGQPPGPGHGGDVDGEGHGKLTEQRLQPLIRQPGSVVERTFEVTFLDPAFRFTPSHAGRQASHATMTSPRRPRRGELTDTHQGGS